MAATAAPPINDLTPTPPEPGLPVVADESGQTPDPEPPERTPDDIAGDTLEVIMPSAEPREVDILNEDGEVVRTYVQKPLSYFRKMQLFRLLAKGLREAIDEGGPGVINDLIGVAAPRNLDALTQTDFADAGQFMQFVTAVVELAPDLLEEAYVIWLAVPPGQREWAKAAMRGDIEGIQPLSDEDGIAILKTFVVQNWGAMQAFFREGVRDVVQVAREQQRRSAPDDQ